jgi:hypothetical protein
MERVVLAPALSFQLPFFLRPKVSKHLQTRTPPLELHLPVYHNRRWNDNQVWPPDTSVAS